MTTPATPVSEPDEDLVEVYPVGEYDVRLLMNFGDCADPQDAVDKFIEDINQYGLRGYTYRVSHEAGEVWLVKDGDITPEADVLGGEVPDGT